MNKKKITAIAVVVAAIAIAIVGATLAFFTDETEKNINTFTVGDVEITLDEATVSTYSDDGVLKYQSGSDRVIKNDYPEIYPDAHLPKDPTIHNVGTNSVYVRMELTIDNVKNFKDIADKHGKSYDELMADMFASFDPSWVRYEDPVVTDTLATYEYIWTDATSAELPSAAPEFVKTNALILPGLREAGADHDTAPIFTEVHIPDWFDNADMDLIDGFKITAYGYGIQVEGDNKAKLIETLEGLGEE